MILLLKRKQKILFQSHIQESADLYYIFNSQHCRLSYLKLGLSGSGNQAILGILVDKYLQAVSYLCSFGNLFPGKKNCTLFISRLSHIYTEVFLSLYCQGLNFS